MTPKKAKRRISEQQHIKTQLALKGFRLADVDRLAGVTPGACRDALRRPHKAGEEAIAAALDVEPHTLWTDRYDQTTGQRYDPQPSTNYDRTPTLREMQNVRAA